jgi:hypothetical protein
MVETITPVVHGGRGRWLAAWAAHAAAASAVGAAFGGLLAGIGALLGAPWGRAGAAAVAIAATAYGLGELVDLRLPVPQLRRQVPDWWRSFFGPTTAALLYGAGLGIGFLTFLAHGTLVVVALAALASGRPLLGAVALGAFGLARGLGALAGGRVGRDDDGRALVDRLAGRPEWPRRLTNGLALVAVGVAAAVAATRSQGGWSALAVAVIALAFAWSSAAKLVAPARWRRALQARRLPVRLERAAAWAVPLAEVGVPILAIVGMRRAASLWALGLLVVFSAEIVRARLLLGRELGCGCFGERRPLQAWAQLVRNGALAAVAGVGAAGATDGAFAWSPGVPEAADRLPAALALAGLWVAIWTAWRSARWLRLGGRR